ncbi:hypothetical protein V5N11_016004 [Cardamine amara subsp. amara]|uniref:Uncharacterized protein n=1 Tax=Cardamine amara subsp. amara TaxID=228776 RepID=A0ABD1A324_CARAN
MTPTTLALFFVSLIIIGTATDVALATKEFQFFPTSQEHNEKSLVFTVEGTTALNRSSRNKDKSRELSKMLFDVRSSSVGCNNDCETACCDCNIEQQPPVCVQCCRI